ncbi:hypothetical protein SUGI_0633810 [Cryptomeria japonica]|nr:hypothetical protein SUGI_0633810 [Cryptomeria japonica]
MKKMGLGDWARSLRLKGRAFTYGKMNTCEETLEERRHQNAQKHIEKILERADRSSPKKAQRIRLQRVDVKVRRSAFSRFMAKVRLCMKIMSRAHLKFSRIFPRSVSLAHGRSHEESLEMNSPLLMDN